MGGQGTISMADEGDPDEALIAAPGIRECNFIPKSMKKDEMHVFLYVLTGFVVFDETVYFSLEKDLSSEILTKLFKLLRN